MDDDAEAQLKRQTYLNMQKEDPNNDDINMISDGIASIYKKILKYYPAMSIVAWRGSPIQSRESYCWKPTLNLFKYSSQDRRGVERRSLLSC
jgi:hypothetical protein